MIRFARLFAVVLLATTATSATALAQDEDDDRKVIYKEKTEIDFEEVDVTGELVKPQGQLLLERKKASFNPLIQLRQDFNEEMKQSIDEVK